MASVPALFGAGSRLRRAAKVAATFSAATAAVAAAQPVSTGDEASLPRTGFPGAHGEVFVPVGGNRHACQVVRRGRNRRGRDRGCAVPPLPTMSMNSDARRSTTGGRGLILFFASG